jgi:ABC-type dipeptide/oligopeptide/nickel transport system permease component
MRLTRYIIRRLLFLIPVLLGAIFITFLLTRMVPGNPIEKVAGPYASDEKVEELKREAGLLDPWYAQFWDYLQDLAHGDMGVSYQTNQPVTTDLRERFPASFELVFFGMTLAVVLALPLGIISAVKQGTWVDHLTRVIAVLGVSMPIFWIALILVSTFYTRLGWLPGPQGRLPISMTEPPHVTGMFTVDSLLDGDTETFKAASKQLILPVLTIGLVAMAPIARMTRATMIDALNSDYIRTARSLGLPTRVIVSKNALKNAIIPVLTLIAAVFGYAIGGEVLVEYIFTWPGLGKYSFDAIMGSDFPAVQGFIILAVAMYVLAYLIVDILIALLDPRVEY